MNSSAFLVGDLCDIIAYVAFVSVTTEEVLNWVYTIVLIISVVFGIIMKIYGAWQDKKVTKEEEEEIRKELKDGVDTIAEEIRRQHTKKSDEDTEK